jgi:hypothetical protein
MKNYKFGVTLMEVIASMFIICIGLLGVLMVIPYGAFQVAKARNAEYISNMLDAGAADLKITGIVKDVEDDRIPIANITNTTPVPIKIIDPFVTHPNATISGIFDAITISGGTEMLRGKDDLNYVLKEGGRTEIKNINGHENIGQYSYFVTMKPKTVTPDGDGTNAIITYTTDLLGCYKRIDDDVASALTPGSPQYYSKAARFTIPSGTLDFSTTKYVFITWRVTTEAYPKIHGEWCRVVNAGTNNSGNQEITVLANEFATERNADVDLTGSGHQIFIFPGVMYHKRIYD